MNEQEFDQIIETAAARMVSGQPPRSLASAVMSRVREDGGESSPRRRFAYAAAALAWLVLLIVFLNRPTAPAVKIASTAEPGAPAPIATPAPAAMPAVPPQPRPIQDQTASVERPPNRATSVRPAMPAAPVPADPLWHEPSILIEPIATAPIEVPALQIGAFPIEEIEIEEIVIEPLAASND